MFAKVFFGVGRSGSQTWQKPNDKLQFRRMALIAVTDINRKKFDSYIMPLLWLRLHLN